MSRFKNPVSVVDKFGVQPVCLPQQQILGQTGIDLWKTYLQNIINQNIKNYYATYNEPQRKWRNVCACSFYFYYLCVVGVKYLQ